MRNVAFRSVESVTQEVVESRDSVSPKREAGSWRGWGVGVGWNCLSQVSMLRKGRDTSAGNESQAQNGVFHELLLGSIPRMPAKVKLPKGRGPG